MDGKDTKKLEFLEDSLLAQKKKKIIFHEK